MELLLTGDTISAAEARAHRAHRPRRAGRPGARDGAARSPTRIAANGPLAVQAIKRSVQATEGLPEDEALKIELEIGCPVFATDDAKEGPARSPRSASRATKAPEASAPRSGIPRRLGRCRPAAAS